MTRQEFDLIIYRLGVLFERPCPPQMAEHNWEIWKGRPKDDLLDSIQIKEEEQTPRPKNRYGYKQNQKGEYLLW